MKTIVFSEDMFLLAELIGAGTRYGETSAIVIGDEDDARQAAGLGANVYFVSKRDDMILDSYVPTIVGLLEELKPEMFLVGATRNGRTIAGRVAAALDTVAITSTKTIDEENGKAVVTQLIYGGGATRSQKAKGATTVVLARHGFGAVPVGLPEGAINIAAFREPKVNITLRQVKTKKASNEGVLTAKVVVGVGSGFESLEQIALARELADALEGEIGYTRPVAEDGPLHIEEEPYIGVSGIQIKPDLYIAVGISGQTQHVVGVNESKVVACINKDENALMFRHSDYGIVGDLNEVLPALTKAVREAQ